MTPGKLVGVLDIDGKAPCVTDDGKTIRLALRKVLYEYAKLKNDSTLFGEIHQQRNFGRVAVVIPNTKEAEDLLKVINSHIGRYLWNVLKKLKANTSFISSLLLKSIDTQLAHEASRCTME